MITYKYNNDKYIFYIVKVDGSLNEENKNVSSVTAKSLKYISYIVIKKLITYDRNFFKDFYACHFI